MDPPVSNVEVGQKIEGVKEASPMFHCNLFDSEVLHKTAQVFLPGLATACVDNTTGGLFKSPASVAADMRKEMVEYLTQRSETFVAESLIQENDPDVIISEHPTDIIAYFVDDFASSKQNLFSRVSSWLLSEKREDKIDDFVQEMEINRFWLMDRRETMAQILVKNVDYKSKYHCNMKFDTPEELENHKNECIYRSMNCTNEGCSAHFNAVHKEKHDLACPFKILVCEQKCSAILLRREMDRHCITVCPMKLVHCPFFSAGCQSSIPQCTIEQHCSEFLPSHLVNILQTVHKEASKETLENRANKLQQTSSIEEMCDIQDLRFLTRIVKELDFKMGPLEHIAPRSLSHECNETECTLRRTDEEETQVLTKEAEIQVQASQEGSSSKAEAEIQGQTSVGKIVDKLDEAEIQVQTSQECLSDKPEIEIQGQTTVEQIVDKLEEGVEMQNAGESVSDKSQEASQEPVDDKQDTEIGVEPVQKPTNVEPISDNQDTEIQLRNVELISDEPNIQERSAEDPTGDNQETDFQLQTSEKPTSDKPEVISDEAEIQEPNSEPGADVQLHSTQEPSAESETKTLVQTSEGAVSDESKSGIQKHISEEPSSNKQDS